MYKVFILVGMTLVILKTYLTWHSVKILVDRDPVKTSFGSGPFGSGPDWSREQ